MAKKKGNILQKDFSNKTVIVMLVLLILVSVASFIFYFDALKESVTRQSAKVTVQNTGSLHASGRATIEILPEGGQQNKSPASESSNS